MTADALAKDGGIRRLAEVVAVLVGRNQKSKYKNTLMGMGWTIASPLLFLLTFYFLFKYAINLGVPRYASHVFTGLVVWAWLQGSLSDAVNCIPGNPGLVSQPRFPTEALPVVAVVSNFINFLLTVPILVIILLLEGARPGLALLALPLVAGVQFLLLLGLCYLVAAWNVPFRDVQYIMPVVLQIAYFATPIFYDYRSMSEGAQQLLSLNPMLQVLEAYRTILIDGAWPDWGAIALLGGFGLVLTFLARGLFQRGRFRFLEEL